uniref:Uncharacterized protein n=1 Tax=Solanum lycopersicum TaxID=4081 RepID=A0A3Q7GI70_SOLLC
MARNCLSLYPFQNFQYLHVQFYSTFSREVLRKQSVVEQDTIFKISFVSSLSSQRSSVFLSSPIIRYNS